MFWVGAGFSIVVGLIRLCFPESQQFIAAKKAGHKSASAGAFWAETKAMLKLEWRKDFHGAVADHLLTLF